MTTDPTNSMEFTGERFIPEETETEITLEHVHRYLMAAELCDGAVVLDAACGAGYGTRLLAAKAGHACGVDVDDQAIAYAAKHFGGDNISFHAASVVSLPFEDAYFDVVVSFETLEHLVEQEAMLEEFKRVLKPGGTLIISTPDRPIYNSFLAEPNAYHVRELTRGEFEAFLRDRFANVALYGQRVAFGSLTLAQSGAALRAIRRLEDNSFVDQDAYDASMYIVAVCSDGPVRPLPTGLYEGRIPQNAMSSLLGGIADRDRTVRSLRDQSAELERALDASQADRDRTVSNLRDQSAKLERALRASQDTHAVLIPRLVFAIQALKEMRQTESNALAAFRALAMHAGRRIPIMASIKLALQDVFVAARRARLRPMRALRLLHEIRLIRSSGLLDSEFYAPQKHATPIPAFENARNYVLAGRDLKPNRLFDGSDYLRQNPDVGGGSISPLAHYIRFGAAEGRLIAPSRQTHFPEDQTRCGWPVAEGHEPSTLGLYDRRPDDDVPIEGRQGLNFMETYGLLGSTPDFGGAVQALTRMAPRARIVGPTDDAEPGASIIVPVYGQLAYTLNCLHSLFSHGAHESFEIIVGDDASPDDSGLYLAQIPHIRYVRHATNLGFVDNCNAAAALARGRYIVLLNNDTRVVPGWLDALIDSFSLFPQAGLVGSKLFYDDGSLQEAGGIIWQDGSAWNYGRDDDPNRPRYCYARQVDYVSGASIAIPTALWKALGGFDEAYRPAYCEDADIAFRIRAMGLQTWMQPLSKVIHYEGRTSGTDLTKGAKAYQVVNSQTLKARWGQVMRTFRPNGQDPARERDRGAKLRVLVIDATTPTPNQDAGSVTSVIHMRLYQQLGYKVHFVPLHNFLYQPGATEDLNRMGVECAYAPFAPNLESFLKVYGRHLDLVHVFRIGVAEEALELLRRFAPQAPVIFANMDMHFLRMERQAQAENDLRLMEEARLMRSRELKLIGEVDCAIVHSEVEEEIIVAEQPNAPVVVFPFITPVMGTGVGYEARADIMFLGGYRHTPNIDAAMFLVKDIWPLVRQALPDARLIIAGAHPPDEIRDLADQDIVVTGQIEDLRSCFDQTRVFAASIRFGAGVKGKVATSMSYGVPVVATTIAAEGMFLRDGRDVVIADDPQAFADALIDLYRNPERWASFSSTSLQFVAEKNSMDTGRALLEEAIRRAHSRHAERVAQWTQEALAAMF